MKSLVTTVFFNKIMKINLRKLIKYEERIGVNNQQNDYYESLFRRTTASYRAKIDRENEKKDPDKRSSNYGPSYSIQAKAKNRKVLSERNNCDTSSNDLLNSFNSSKSPVEKIAEESNTNRSLKALVEKMLTQVLNEKYSPALVNEDQENLSKEKSTIKSMIEKIIKEKLLHHPIEYKESLNTSQGSLSLIIENIVTQVLREKFSNIQNQSKSPKIHIDEMSNLNKDFQQKLTISNNHDNVPREQGAHYKNHTPLDSQSLVAELLSPGNAEKKQVQNKTKNKPKTDKENTKSSMKSGSIKRLERSPRKKPEWQDISLHDVLNKPVNAVSSSVRSGRGSSVLIRRSKSNGRKPTSDPVALYQYYKNEWEHFRNQIPGETSHGRLRWQVRQRLLDPK